MILLDRILLGITALVLLLLAGALLATIWGSPLITSWLLSSNLRFDASVIASILILLAIYIIILIAKRERRKYIIYPRELGEVKISTFCIESLIMEASREIPGLAQVRASFADVVSPKVILRVVVYPDHNLSELSEELQEKVRAYVEKTVGIVIQEIEVFVDEISKRSVEANVELDKIV